MHACARADESERCHGDQIEPARGVSEGCWEVTVTYDPSAFHSLRQRNHMGEGVCVCVCVWGGHSSVDMALSGVKAAPAELQEPPVRLQSRRDRGRSWALTKGLRGTITSKFKCFHVARAAALLIPEAHTHTHTHTDNIGHEYAHTHTQTHRL